MDAQILARLAIPTSIALISFLGYGSQYLFHKVEPGPFVGSERFVFNGLMLSIFIAYLRACYTDPGWVPKDWDPSQISHEAPRVPTRRCRKCKANKPARAHHCKICGRCVPKMDHHCPWTSNCVSRRTFPHFFRFLSYSVVTMTYLEYALFMRASFVWGKRHEPSYLGPSASQLVLLFVEIIANSITLFCVGLLFLHNFWRLVANTTTIEGWEIERHDALFRRARRNGGYVDGPDGIRMRITKQEFPFDVGLFSNVTQGMTGPMLFWLFPFAPDVSNDSGLRFETNGFDDRPWPPPDPDRLPRQPSRSAGDTGFLAHQDEMEPSAQISAFRQRQFDDMQRPRYRHDVRNDTNGLAQSWTNSEGERLDDFGVDDIEDTMEDQMALSELIEKRKQNG